MIEEILKLAQDAKASDIHFTPKHPAMFRIDGKLCMVAEEAVSEEDIDRLLHAVLNKAQWRMLEKEGETETAATLSDSFRIRINAYRQQGNYAAAIRLLSLEIPQFQDLGMPDSILESVKEDRGLILLTGQAGSGRTTTAASLLNEIARNEAKHIVTIENPVEYLLPQGKSLISQREVGTDTGSYAKALRAAVQQDADVIFVSKLPDADTVSEAILAVEAGVLVIALLPNRRTEDALRQLIDMFPTHRKEQARAQLSEVFSGAFAQQFLPCIDGKGRIIMTEALLTDKEIRMMIREDRLSLLSSAMEQRKHAGMQTMDDAILAAYMKSMISAETAVWHAQDPEQMRRRMKIY